MKLSTNLPHTSFCIPLPFNACTQTHPPIAITNANSPLH